MVSPVIFMSLLLRKRWTMRSNRLEFYQNKKRETVGGFSFLASPGRFERPAFRLGARLSGNFFNCENG